MTMPLDPSGFILLGQGLSSVVFFQVLGVFLGGGSCRTLFWGGGGSGYNNNNNNNNNNNKHFRLGGWLVDAIIAKRRLVGILGTQPMWGRFVVINLGL